MNMHIRPGTRADIPAVHRLVGELADYVGARPQFTATLDDYYRDFDDGFFELLVAEDDARGVVGMALYVYVYSTWKGRMLYLEDFVLLPEFRRRGIGSRIWEALKETGRGRGCKLMKWQIVNTNKQALHFYAAQEAEIEDQWLNGKLVL